MSFGSVPTETMRVRSVLIRISVPIGLRDLSASLLSVSLRRDGRGL